MSEMVERVADAILLDLTDRSGFGNSWDSCDDEIKNEIRKAIGRAAIFAMREPTNAMIEAHIETCAGDAAEAGPERTGQAWRAMIDEALK